jgi:LmbE family N-acetylglucosaminyl deacetylase
MFSQTQMTVACVVAHPDDEVLACGASLARHARLGHRVETLIMATGLDARGSASAQAHDAHRQAAVAAAAKLGIPSPRHAGLPDNRLDTVALLDVIKLVEIFFSEIDPHVVYTHHRSDLNVDHRVVHDAVLTAGRPLPGSGIRRILAGETLSSTEWQPVNASPFTPTVFHDASDVVDAKVAALEAYAGEIRPFPHPRSSEAVRALAAFRGVQSGYPAAEAFMLIRSRD